MTTFLLAAAGGGVSFLATSVGVVLSSFKRPAGFSNRWSLSVDFALGLMVSASAFSLIGPAAVGSAAIPSGSLTAGALAVIAAVLLGGLFVYALKAWLDVRQAASRASTAPTAQLLLASVLMLHNFPEGLASGAALAGLGWHSGLPILGGIAVQNVPEGALMVLCLKAMGWSDRRAFWGGILSAAVEMSGGLLAGVLLQFLDGVLPLLLSFAGGAMLVSVYVELIEGEARMMSRIVSSQFLIGLLCIPLLKVLGF